MSLTSLPILLVFVHAVVGARNAMAASEPSSLIQQLPDGDSTKWSPLESDDRDRVCALLPALLPAQANYHLRKRSLAVQGAAEVLSWEGALARVLDPAEAEGQPPDAILPGGGEPVSGWWRVWKSHGEERGFAAQSSDLGFHVQSEPGVFLRLYTRVMPGVELTERPVADLFTAQHYLMLTEDKRFGAVVHLMNRLNYVLEDPRQLLSPLPADAHRVERLKKWTWTRGHEFDRQLVMIQNPNLRDVCYSLILDSSSGLPRAAVLRSGVNTLASVYSWAKNAEGTIWLSSVARITTMEGRYQLEWFEVSEVDLAPEGPVCLSSSTPVKLLDQRFGRPQYVDFSMDKLPQDVRDAFVVR